MSTEFWGQLCGAFLGVLFGQFIVDLWKKVTAKRRIAKLRKEWERLAAEGKLGDVHIL